MSFDSLLENAAYGLLVAVAVFVWRFVRRRGHPVDGVPVLSDQIRFRLLEVARARSWGQLRDLVGLPDGFTELRLEPRVGLVTGARSESVGDRPGVVAEAGIVEAFEGNGRRLLLVGGPGSGKTVLAYKIAAHLDSCHQAGPGEPLPVVLNLTTWTPATGVAGWVVDQLCDPVTGFGLTDRVLAQDLVTMNRLALILDGLDEVPELNRSACLAAINDFITSRPPPPVAPLVVTCRRVEYETLITHDMPLGLLAAREPLPLDPDTVAHNIDLLAERDARWMAFTRHSLHRVPGHVVEALQSPLLLSLAAETDFDPDQLLTSTTADLVGQQICATKVDTVLTRPDIPPTTANWLTAIAKALQTSTTNQTVFQFEHLTPPTGPPWLKTARGLFVGLVFGLLGLVFGLVGGLGVVRLVGLLVGLLGLVAGRGGLDARPTQHIYRRPNRAQLRHGLFVGLVGGLLGLVVGLLGLVVGLVFGLVFGLVGGLVFGLVFGLVVGLVDAFRVDVVVRGASVADQGLLASRRSYTASVLQYGLVVGLLGLVVGLLDLVVGLVFGLVFGLVGGLVFGLVFGLDDGGGYVVLQWVRRRQLRRAGVMPADPVASLEWAVRSRLMRQVGGGFQFRHNLLRDAVAARDPDGEIPALVLYG